LLRTRNWFDTLTPTAASVDDDGTSCYDAPPGECMKMTLLRSLARRDLDVVIRSARNDDWSSVERLLSFADRHYMALEWWTVQEWLGRPTFLLASDPRGRPQGVMLTVTGDGPIAWLRLISLGSDAYLIPLIEASAQAVSEQGGSGIAFLGNEGWLLAKLKHTGFQQVNQVVTLRHRGHWPTQFGPSSLQVRAATAADIDAILTVDHAAFEPMWWYDREALLRAMNLASYFDVAYLDAECVGYQLSTLRNGRGHIVRLAAHPRWQRRGIGGRLLSGVMRTLENAGAHTVTVNTQEDNLASHQLYQRFSFEPVGTPWPVWFRSLVQRQ
jgi:ribosomal-protein-alanine N-acetyltransferase